MKRSTRALISVVVAFGVAAGSGCAGWGPNTNPRNGWVRADSDAAGNVIQKACDMTTLVHVFPGEGLMLEPNSTECGGNPANPSTARPSVPELEDPIDRWVLALKDPMNRSIMKGCEGPNLLYVLPREAVAAVKGSPQCNQSAAPDSRARTQWVEFWEDDPSPNRKGLPLAKRCNASTLVYKLGGEGTAVVPRSADCDPSASLSVDPRNDWASPFGPKNEDAVVIRCYRTTLVYAIAGDALALEADVPACGASGPSAGNGSTPSPSAVPPSEDPRNTWVLTMHDSGNEPIHRRCLAAMLVFTLAGDGLSNLVNSSECRR